jgi:ankyrin repeat protein
MLDYCSRYQSTLLISAIGSFHSEAAVWLVANGAKVNARDKDGNTAYLEAVTRRDTYAEAFLVHKNAKVDVVDNEGRCASFIKWQYAQLANGKRANA